MKLSRDYDGSQYGIDLNSTEVQKMAEGGPTHATLQETVYGWLKGTTIYVMSDLSNLTYADFVEHIGCDAQEYLYKELGHKRGYVWIATDKPIAKFIAFFCKNEDTGEWTIYTSGSVQVNMPDDYIDNLKNS